MGWLTRYEFAANEGILVEWYVFSLVEQYGTIAGEKRSVPPALFSKLAEALCRHAISYEGESHRGGFASHSSLDEGQV